MNKVVKCIVSISLLLIVALVAFLLDTSGVRSSSNHYNRIDTLKATIGVDGGMYYSKGFPIAAQYALLKEFSDLEGAELFANDDFKEGYTLSALLRDSVDVVIVAPDDSLIQTELNNQELIQSIQIFGAVWIVKRGRVDHLSEKINKWIGYFLQTERYHYFKSNYFASYLLDSYKESLTQTDRISPFDDLIKKYSSVLGWDWRMLAAIIYKESRFSVAAESSRGAKGLMQLGPSVAKTYSVRNLIDPDENIRAGVKFLGSIQSRYRSSGLDSVNAIKFTLAAYNAGESRVGDCIIFTRENGGDPTDWESVSRYIPMMSMPEYYLNADYLNHGAFNGTETIRYVDDVTSIFEEYLFYVRK